jgi:hypothetical protein
MAERFSGQGNRDGESTHDPDAVHTLYICRSRHLWMRSAFGRPKPVFAGTRAARGWRRHDDDVPGHGAGTPRAARQTGRPHARSRRRSPRLSSPPRQSSVCAHASDPSYRSYLSSMSAISSMRVITERSGRLRVDHPDPTMPPGGLITLCASRDKAQTASQALAPIRGSRRAAAGTRPGARPERHCHQRSL